MVPWLIAAVVVSSALFGAISVFAIFQTFKNSRLEGRIQGVAQQLRNVPKRKTDRGQHGAE